VATRLTAIRFRAAIPRSLLRTLRWVLLLALLVAALWALRGQWPAILEVLRTTRPRWGLVALSALLVLSTYALLIETWRLVLHALGATLSRAGAAVVWLGSNLARYLPFSLWQLGVMSVMAKQRGVALADAGTAALLVTIVNVFTGIAVFACTAARVPSLGGKGLWFLALGALALVSAPFALPLAARVASRLTGRTIVLPKVGARTVVIAAIGTTLAWLMYGVAFWVLAQAVLPDASRSLSAAIAIYTGSYLAGFLAIVPPAGLGVAEGAMIELGALFHFAAGPELAALAIIVRLWRTVLEIAPGLVALIAESFAARTRARV
jgi:uncharacterized membrane protein YbhN (UPF0104 family)